MLHPELLTFTGADDLTSIADMEALAADHLVEFAILFSGSREGDARYPSRAWMAGLNGAGLKLAAHVCGSWARDIVETGASDIHDRLTGFDRIQINTSLHLDLDLISGWGRRLSDSAGRVIPIILQTRDAFPKDNRVQWLFDASGGRGIVPSAWPAASTNPNVRMGFAGGLGPKTVEQCLALMPDVKAAWIDMETRVRNERDEFDLGMCRVVCERVAAMRFGMDLAAR